jgi:tetratricopeptide (TPR) repeat protein
MGMMKILDDVKRAEKLQKESKFSEALSIYEKVDKVLSENDFDDEWLYYLRLNEGHCARLAGEFKKSIRYYRFALRIARRIDERAIADAHAGLGTAFRAIGRLNDAIENFEIAVDIYRKIKDEEGLAYILWAKGGTLRFMGFLKDAFEMFKDAFSIYKKLRNKSGIGYSLCGLGGVSRIMGNFDDSLEYYTNANNVLRSLKDKFGIAYSYCGIANANRMLGNFEKAQHYFNLATKNYEEIGDKISYAYTLWGEGTLAKVIGNFEKAIEKFSRAEKIFRETGDKRGLIYTELGKIEINYLMGKKISEKKFDEIFEISKKYGYNFERLHVQLVRGLMKGENVCDVLNEYERLGSRFAQRINLEFPLNLP